MAIHEITFYNWLRKYEKEDSPRGDLAYDSRGDTEVKNSFSAWENHLYAHGAIREAHKTLKECWKEYKSKNINESTLKSKYGITKDEYLALVKKQKGKCAICKLNPIKKRLAVDHCHTTKKVRGLLCTNCNMGLGFFKDNIDSLQEAINYLKK